MDAPKLIGTKIAYLRILDRTILKRIGAFMPRYFFDIDDGVRRARDEWGMELPDVRHAMEEASRLLRTLAEVRNIERSPGITFVKFRMSEDEYVIEVSTRLDS